MVKSFLLAFASTAPLDQIWVWFWANLDAIASLVILGGAVLGVIAYLAKQLLFTPNLHIDPVTIKTDEPPLFAHGLYWDIRNDGRSTAEELSIGIMIQSADYRSLHVRDAVLSRHSRLLFGYEYKEGTDPPVFHFRTAYFPWVDNPAMHIDEGPDLKLEWKRHYIVEIAYRYKDSSSHTSRWGLGVFSQQEGGIELFELVDIFHRALRRLRF
jgi:hypothetical protein